MKYSLLLPLLATLPLAVPAGAQQTIPLAAYADGPLRKVAVIVAGDTLDFLFDTGGGVDIISPDLARQLGCAPSGRIAGYRLTGEHLEAPVCRDVPMQLGDFHFRGEVGVLDLMELLGPRAPVVHGMISLRAFQGQSLTVDPAAQRLIVETPASLAARVAALQPVPVRLATGLQGAQLDVFVGVPAGDALLWLLWDSGNAGPTLLAPWAASALAVDTARPLEPVLQIGDQPVLVPAALKRPIIHDGVLNARLIERSVWTLDLARGRLWVGELAPLLTLPTGAQALAPAPPRTDARGWYELTMVVNGGAQSALLHVQDGHGRLRFLGEERTFTIERIDAAGGRLRFALPMNRTYPVEITFTGFQGSGTWGDAERGGKVTALKVR